MGFHAVRVPCFEGIPCCGVKVTHSAPEVMKLVSDGAGDAVTGREVKAPLLIGVTSDGVMRVRTHPK